MCGGILGVYPSFRAEWKLNHTDIMFNLMCISGSSTILLRRQLPQPTLTQQTLDMKPHLTEKQKRDVTDKTADFTALDMRPLEPNSQM